MSPEDFGERLRELRQRRGISQERLAKLAQISADSVSRIERGQTSPTLDTLIKLGRAFGLPMIGLLYDNFDRPDELAALIRELPADYQSLTYTLVGAMRVQCAISDD